MIGAQLSGQPVALLRAKSSWFASRSNEGWLSAARLGVYFRGYIEAHRGARLALQQPYFSCHARLSFGESVQRCGLQGTRSKPPEISTPDRHRPLL
jgi:hypothetical protein